MELIRGTYNLTPDHVGCVLTIGNFDGLHLGHQAVLRNLRRKGQELGLPTVVMTFEPQPQELFAGDQAPARLTRLREKFHQLDAIGIDRLLCVRFNHDFAGQSPEYFVEHLLVKQLGVRYLVIGDDFRFGKQRSGDFAMLQRAGMEHGFEVVSTQSYLKACERVSSTRIRQLLEKGQMEQVSLLLGRDYSISGRVAHGRKLGRELGFPTANVWLKRKVTPVTGVFCVQAELANKKRYNGVANIGNRPTVSGQRQQLEVHLFDFDGHLYGQQISVRLIHRLRGEKKFNSVGELSQQIELDIQAAKAFLKPVDFN